MELFFEITLAGESDICFADQICAEIADSAGKRGTGISKRNPKDIAAKMVAGKAIIATCNGQWAGFCYIETWSGGEFVSTSALIVAPQFRNHGLATALKQKATELASKKFPAAKMFGLTTSAAVMKINSDLGFTPVTYENLPQDEIFWQGCRSCVNHSILESKKRKNCICTAMLRKPEMQLQNQNISHFAEVAG